MFCRVAAAMPARLRNLLVDGKVVLSAVGKNDNRMQPRRSTCARSRALGEARNRGQRTGRVGQHRVDTIVFSDRPAAHQPGSPIRPDFARSFWRCSAPATRCAVAGLPDGGVPGTFESDVKPADIAVRPFDQKADWFARAERVAGPGEEQSIALSCRWRSPNLRSMG